MVLLAFGCEARVGKDTAVEYLITKNGGLKTSFASPLYDIQEYTHKRLGLVPQKDRRFLQIIGDWGRQKNSHLFINVLLREIDHTKGNIYVSDVRYPNEFFSLKNRGFTMVRLTRKNRFVSADQKIAAHSSENSLQDYPWDVILSNDKELPNLYTKLDRVYTSIAMLGDLQDTKLAAGLG